MPSDYIHGGKGASKTAETKTVASETQSVTAETTPAVKSNEKKKNTKRRGRSRKRKSEARRGNFQSSSTSSDISRSPLPPKLEVFTGDPKYGSWSSFISKFDRIAEHREWSDNRKLDRLFNCLSEKALEFGFRSDEKASYVDLKKVLRLRFDLRDEPVAARQRLHLVKQTEDEPLEEYMQRVLTIAMNGYADSDNHTVQQLATEAFLRGSKNKEAASVVIQETPRTIQEACRKNKTVIANRKAILGSKVSFQERFFTLDEERRVADLERKYEDLARSVKRASSPYRDERQDMGFKGDRDRNIRYSPSPYRSPPAWDRNRGNQRRGLLLYSIIDPRMVLSIVVGTEMDNMKPVLHQRMEVKGNFNPIEIRFDPHRAQKGEKGVIWIIGIDHHPEGTIPNKEGFVMDTGQIAAIPKSSSGYRYPSSQRGYQYPNEDLGGQQRSNSPVRYEDRSSYKPRIQSLLIFVLGAQKTFRLGACH